MSLWLAIRALSLAALLGTVHAETNTIRLRIVDAEGNAISRAVAVASGPGESFLARATSTASGEAELSGLPGKGPFRVQVQSWGFEPKALIVDQPSRGEITVMLNIGWAPIDLLTEPPHLEPVPSPIPVLRVTVVDTASAAIARATIEVRGPGGLLVRSATRDDGDAVLMGLTRKVPLALMVAAPGFATLHAAIIVDTECERTIKLEVRKDLEGTRYYADPPPVEPRPESKRKPWWRRL